jgi:hypothetical protein
LNQGVVDQASVLLALQNLDAKYREPLVAELLSMSRELRRLPPGRMVHIWFIYGSYMIHIALVDIQWDLGKSGKEQAQTRRTAEQCRSKDSTFHCKNMS